MNRRNEELLLIEGPSGSLEIVVNEPSDTSIGCALIAHPHPLYGGTFNNKVVQTLAKAFCALGLTAVRFNFRGVGNSDGVYDGGTGEIEDFEAVLTYASNRFQPKYLIFSGFSFGTYVVARAAKDKRPHQVVLIAPAVGKFKIENVPADSLVLHGEEDDVVLLSDVLDWARPQHVPVTVLPGAGHFFHGDLIRLQNVVINHCRQKLSS
ncbi:MAG: alpha/beta hydrolase [Proteobacteria bacterium]|nr:alpha/beta hydrolase [Pseudomonadota bacterium]